MFGDEKGQPLNYSSQDFSQLGGMPNQSGAKVGFKKKIIITLVVVIFLLAGSAGAFYYYSSVINSPENILNAAFDHMLELNSGSFDYHADLSFEPAEEPTLGASPFVPTNFNLEFLISSDFKKTDDDFFQTKSEITIDFPVGAQIPFVMEGSFRPKIDIISLDKDNIFLKLSGLPAIAFFDLNNLNDQWIKINFDEAGSQYSGFRISGPGGKTIEGVREKMVELYKENSFFILTKLPDEKVNDKASYHLNAKFDKELFKKFVVAFGDFAEQEGLSNDMDFDVDRQLEDLDESLENVELAIEFWIDKSDKLFQKVKIDLLVADEFVTVNQNGILTLRNHNQPIEISEPQEAMTFEELMKTLMSGNGGSFSGSISFGGDDKVISQVKQLQTALELYHNDHDRYPFSPIGGNKLGFDHNSNCLGGKGFLPTCSDSETTYLSVIEPHPNAPLENYNYYVCGEGSYIIEFYLAEDTAGMKAGKNYAWENGLVSNLGINDQCFDNDFDGLSNYYESKYGTNPMNSDTDGDGYIDGAEVMGGYNPNGAGTL